MKKYQLMAPGPTPVPSEVLLAMARPMIHHRTPEYAALFDEVRAGLKRLVQTRQDVLTPACTGTGAMEAAVANTLSAGDRVIVVNAGAFAQRWMAIAKAYRLQIVELAAPHGETVTPERVAEALRTHQDVKAVLVQHSESSTGVLHDVRAYAQVTAGTDAIVIVDAVSSLGIADVQMDAWAIDVLVSASQKGLMLPPGLDADPVVEGVATSHNITIDGGRGPTKGKIFRIGHMGYAAETDVIIALAALEQVLADLGQPVDFGASVRAAQKVFVEKS